MIIKKGHGYFRKSKAYGLSSCIVLGTTLLLGTGVVSAQETTAKTEAKTEQVAKQETKTNNTESTKDDSNAKLLEAIKKAKENHVIVELTKDVNYKTATEAKADIDGQIKTINSLTELVSNANERLSKVVNEATKAGVKLDKEIKLTLTPGKEEDFKKAVEQAEKNLKDSIIKQAEASKTLTDAIAKADKENVKVNVKGEKVVSAKDADEAVKKEIEKIDKAIHQQKEKQTAYEKALKLWNDNNAQKKKILDENKTLKAKLTSESTAKNNNGVYHQILKGKSLLDEASSATVQRKPMDLIAIVDFSSSLQAKRPEALRQLKTLIEKNLNTGDKVMLQGYIYNKEESYTAHGAQLDYAKLRNADWETGFSTKLVTKEEALSIIDKWLGINPPNTPNGVATYSDYFNAAARAMGDLGFKTDEVDSNNFVKKVPFEEVYTSQPNKNQTVSVIQFTDGWGDKEQMDPTFAAWAKKNAKTFMSVVNRNQVSAEDNNGEFSINSMKELGHPNIYDSTGKDKEVVMKEILEQFKNTAVETFTSKKKITSKGVVNIKADKNVKLTSVKLVSPTGKKQDLKIENNAVNTEVNLTEKGDYTVEYEFSATNNEAGNITGSFTVNSKEEVSGDKVNASSKDLPSTKDEKTDKLTPTIGQSVKDVEKPKAPEPISVDVEKIVVSTEKPVVEDVKATAHKTTVTKEEPKKEAPKVEKQLPKTNTNNSIWLSVLGTFIASFSALLYRKGKSE